MNEKKIGAAQRLIDGLEHWELAYLWRFCDAGHPYFDHTLPLYKRLEARFMKFGGMTKDMSRSIGWGRDPVLHVDELTRWVTKMKVSKLIEKLGERRDKYLGSGHIKNAITIQDIIVELADHLLITGDHELAEWTPDA